MELILGWGENERLGGYVMGFQLKWWVWDDSCTLDKSFSTRLVRRLSGLLIELLVCWRFADALSCSYLMRLVLSKSSFPLVRSFEVKAFASDGWPYCAAAITWHERRREWIGDQSKKSQRARREPIMRYILLLFFFKFFY